MGLITMLKGRFFLIRISVYQRWGHLLAPKTNLDEDNTKKEDDAKYEDEPKNEHHSKNAAKAGKCRRCMQLRHGHVVSMYLCFLHSFFEGVMNFFSGKIHDAGCMMHDA